jgi:hypothetical protein
MGSSGYYITKNLTKDIDRLRCIIYAVNSGRLKMTENVATKGKT